MKKLLVIFLSVLMVFPLAACGNSSRNRAEDAPEESRTTAPDAEQQDNGTDSVNILVAYFSVMETDGVDTVAGASRVAVDGEVLGNNQYIAQIIQQQVGGDLPMPLYTFLEEYDFSGKTIIPFTTHVLDFRMVCKEKPEA